MTYKVSVEWDVKPLLTHVVLQLSEWTAGIGVYSEYRLSIERYLMPLDTVKYWLILDTRHQYIYYAKYTSIFHIF